MITPSGNVEPYAGGGQAFLREASAVGDIRNIRFGGVPTLAMSPRGELYMRDAGYITRVDGSAYRKVSGDIQQLWADVDFTVDSNGDIYFSKYPCLCKISAGGEVTNVSPIVNQAPPCGFADSYRYPIYQYRFQSDSLTIGKGDNLLATQRDGFYRGLWRLDPEGYINSVLFCGREHGYSPDLIDVPVKSVFQAPFGRITETYSGDIYSTLESGFCKTTGCGIIKIDARGMLRTLMYDDLGSPMDICAAPDGDVFYTDNAKNRIMRIRNGASSNEVHDTNGQTYVFDETGKHLRTYETETGVTLFTFQYDDKGNLISQTDRFGDTITIERSGDTITAIVAPDGQRTTLTVSDNRLGKLSYPDGSGLTFEYDSNGLMTRKTDPKNNLYTVDYDDNGRVTEAHDPAGGHWSFNATNEGLSQKYTVTTAEGIVTSYLDTYLSNNYTSVITDAFGGVTNYKRSASELHVEVDDSCGFKAAYDLSLDPLYDTKYLVKSVTQTPSGLKATTTFAREYVDADKNKLPEMATRRATRNGKTATVIDDIAAGKITYTSPAGRTSTTIYNVVNLLTQSSSAPGLATTNYTYDDSGRATKIQTGERYVEYTYAGNGNVQSVTDALQRTTSYDYDAMDRTTAIHRPDGKTIRFEYDPNGNMKVLDTPSQVHHDFDYTSVNQVSQYKTPLSGSYEYQYDLDKRLRKIVFPSNRTIENLFDGAKLTTVRTPEGDINYSYDPCGARINSVSMGGEAMSYAYDGVLLTSQRSQGIVNQTLGYAYDNDFALKTFSYAGTNVDYGYDLDGLLTKVGRYTIDRNAQNGLAEAMRDGVYAQTMAHNQYGETSQWSTTIGGAQVATYTLSRNLAGHIIGRNETVAGVIHEYAYSYDALGRLRNVWCDGAIVEQYEYDGPHNARSSETNALRNITNRAYAYDAEDKLLSAGDASFDYDADGFLTRKLVAGQETRYTYSSRGELLRVDLPDGRVIEYLHDALGRRAAKKVNGQLLEKYLWEGRTTLLAVYDANDNLKQRFEYAGGRLPVSMVAGGQTYYFSYDQVGTMRAVFNAAGQAVKAVDYDSFGNAISDSNAGFAVPFGFAGGLYDADTKLTRFGFRDYDSDVGRWTAKDPIGFAGGDTDLMGYCFSNPTNAYDVLGLTDAPTTTPTVPTAPGPTTAPPAGPTNSTDEKTPSNEPFEGFYPALYDMAKTYIEMRIANTKCSDKYFHCMANCRASQRGPAGVTASKMVSNAREYYGVHLNGDDPADSAEDQTANAYGRCPGVDCKSRCAKYRPKALSYEY